MGLPRPLSLLISATALFAACAAPSPEVPSSPPPADSASIPPLSMTITSYAFAHNARIPSVYTCDGEDTSPPLAIADVPAGAKSLVLISDDPDAPMGTWVHWLIWNIDPKTTEIPAGSVPPGAIEGTTSFGRTGYGGPCPPSGEHRYFFKLYALDTTLDLPESTDKSGLEAAMEGHVIGSEELVGLYSRQ